MSNKIRIKKSSVAAKVPLVADLDYGELAINYADGLLYYKKSDATIQSISSGGIETLATVTGRGATTTVAISTGAITSSGNILVGATSVFNFNGNAWGVDKIIFRTDVLQKILTDGSGNFNWLTAGKNWTLSDVGNVGIGTTAPTSGFILDANGSILARTDLRVGGTSGSLLWANTSGGYLAVSSIMSRENASTLSLSGRQSASSGQPGVLISTAGGLVATDIAVQMGGSGGGQVYLLQSGNVGIGIATPLSSLDVRTAGTGELGRFATGGSGPSYLLVGGGSSTTEGLRLTYDNSNGSSTINNYYNAALKFATNNTVGMTLDASSNLSVVGTATATRHIATTSTAVDAVGVFGFNSVQGTYIFSNAGSGRVFSLYNGSGGEQYTIGTDYTHIWYTNTAQRMALTATGLGVGASSPAAKLDVSGNQVINIVAVPILNVDCSLGNYFTITIAGTSTLTFSNPPASRAYAFTLEVTHTSGSITWPATVQWPSATAPTLTTGKTHLFVFVTDDAGTRWRGVSSVDYTN